MKLYDTTNTQKPVQNETEMVAREMGRRERERIARLVQNRKQIVPVASAWDWRDSKKRQGVTR